MTVTERPACEFLQTAEEIARCICDEAIWHESRCNWLGADPLERGGTTYQSNVTFSTLGTDLYSGTCGIAFFLAELSKVTGDSRTRRTALGAIRHAISHAETLSSSARMGLFSGWFGIALVAARVGMILGEPDLKVSALELLNRASSEKFDEHDFDIMSGRAGAISGLLVLRQMLEESSLLEFAICLGDQLVESAERSAVGLSWRSPRFKNYRNLTGFSHGAAGAACALLELSRSTGIKNIVTPRCWHFSMSVTGSIQERETGLTSGKMLRLLDGSGPFNVCHSGVMALQALDCRDCAHMSSWGTMRSRLKLRWH